MKTTIIILLISISSYSQIKNQPLDYLVISDGEWEQRYTSPGINDSLYELVTDSIRILNLDSFYKQQEKEYYKHEKKDLAKIISEYIDTQGGKQLPDMTLFGFYRWLINETE